MPDIATISAMCHEKITLACGIGNRIKYHVYGKIIAYVTLVFIGLNNQTTSASFTHTVESSGRFLNQFSLQGFGYCLGAIMNIQFFKDKAYASLD